MASLDFCSKHNMVAYLEKNDGNTEFHQVMDFLTHSSIHYVLTVIQVLNFVVNVLWTKTSIRSNLLFNDVDGIDSMTNQAIFDNIQLMGPTEEEGEVSERPSESQPIPSPTHTSEDQFEPQSDQSLRPSSSIPISDSNPESSGGNHGEIKGLKAQIKQLKKNARPGRKAVKSSKGAPSVHTHTDWDDMDTDFEASLDEVIDYTPAQNKGINGKGRIKEEDESDTESEDITEVEKKLKMLARDEEVARQLEADLQAEMERERQREEEDSIVTIREMYDEVQVGIDADALFAAKLQQEEREEYTIEERAKFLNETIAAQRKFRATQRSVEIRSRPPTKSQLRNLMMTYLKNMSNYKHSQLKAKRFKEIQEGSCIHKKKVTLEELDSTKVEVKQKGHEGSFRKRPGKRLKMKATKKSKRQKTNSDIKEEKQLKTFL
ncbi:hypothetical protein Tco_0204557 [Tanacetum coccineum]